MIVTNILEKVLNLLLLPLDAVNFGVNWLLGIDWVVDVLNIIAYVLPWENLIPLIIGIIGMYCSRIAISLVRLILEILPL